ncbi:Hypothetical predicted protein [Octopus vulgaris]|uniref:Uncharacterized protein n=1 Tax=Octopus vulgaris TaxID=6645 RepID=A0AA36B4I8_OCTVU|nr:Hypothetical predicted protein [Octopus vulgaris]
MEPICSSSPLRRIALKECKNEDMRVKEHQNTSFTVRMEESSYKSGMKHEFLLDRSCPGTKHHLITKMYGDIVAVIDVDVAMTNFERHPVDERKRAPLTK